jgi:hypothetical protein
VKTRSLAQSGEFPVSSEVLEALVAPDEDCAMRLIAVCGVAVVTLATMGFAQEEAGQKAAKKSEPEAGKPVNGLVASAEVVEYKPSKEPPYFEVRFSLKNVSDKPITICNYVGNQPLKVEWIGSDGKTLKSDHYGWLRYVDLAGATEKNFVTIPAGAVYRIGPQGEGSGITFQTTPEKPQRFGNVTQSGKHRVTVSFVSMEDGKEFKLENVWVGSVTAKEVVLNVK